jgi:hypothetical protein
VFFPRVVARRPIAPSPPPGDPARTTPRLVTVVVRLPWEIKRLRSLPKTHQVQDRKPACKVQRLGGSAGISGP